MKHLSGKVGLMLAALALPVLAFSDFPAQAAAAPTVLEVRGTILNTEITGPASFENKVGGDLAGDLIGIVYQGLNSELDGTLRLLVVHVFVTPQGNLYALADAVLTPNTQTASPTDYEVKERNFILGGSGKYRGATGEIQLVGPFDVSTGAGSVSYSGKITLP
jgi:hypothetical protein